jgi:hypothetical protein
MNEIVGKGRPYLRLTRAGARVVRRAPEPAGFLGLLGLGQTSQCGPAPGLGPGEKKQCCPGVGWVIYDSSESEYGICERAKAGGSSSSSAPSSSPASTSEDPMARVEEMRRRLDERREQREERDFERQKAEMQLRFIMGQMQSVQQKENARIRAKRAREAAIAAAKAKAEADRQRRERNKKLAIAGGIGLVAAKVLGFI